ncbi:MAG TPA: hypothetical protein PKD10_01350 [Paracoccaceae bacterium]|nr:hypothetical protein [Paracoccaceae bacterium]HMO72248.1 hypothetical protein [Paracoccaceae bacterium]
MPLPALALSPAALWALRAGAAGLAFWAGRRALAGTATSRTDQRAEDALDDLDDGLAAHAPPDRDGQRNAALRMRRVLRWPGGGIEVDLSAMARLRLRRLRDDGQGAAGKDD